MQQLPIIPSTFNSRVGTVIDGTPYILDIRWNGRDAAWYMDILAEDESPIRTGVKLVLGAFLGGRTVDPRFPFGALVASDLSGEGRDATFDDLGTRLRCYFINQADVDAFEPAAPAPAAAEPAPAPTVAEEGIAFQFTWPVTGSTATVTIPVTMIGNYVVTGDFEDPTASVSLLAFPYAGRTTTTFPVDAGGSIDAGTTIGFFLTDRA
jgi:hypothetical protein